MDERAERRSWAWWQSGVIYQVYPRSFQDSNADGIGDLPGIVARLPYLAALGVDAIWLSPFYPSPMADFGYDVSNYCDVDPIFGTLDDFDSLLECVHAHGLKLIIDFVPNHTSDQHPWFIESRSSRDAPKRDWYIWHDPAADDGPPTNWMSQFGGSAWTWDEATDQYYMHSFLAAQPDLNWRNPEVQVAMLGAMRFWLDRGVDGFRLDAIWAMIKDDRFRDNLPNPDWRPGMPFWDAQRFEFSQYRPEVHDILRKMRMVTDEYPGTVLIGEIYASFREQARYFGGDLDECQLPFNFALIMTPWNAKRIASAMLEYESVLPFGGWPNWVLGNHDQPRIASRIGRAQARIAAMLLLTLRGTPTIYYGDELGLEDGVIPPDRRVDPAGRDHTKRGRDPERVPMPWDATRGHGFTDGEPWLPFSDQAMIRNVAAECDDPDSMLSLQRALLALRRAEPALAVGEYGRIWSDEDVLAYERADGEGERRFLILLNLSARPASLALEERTAGAVVLGTHRDRTGKRVENNVSLAANEGIVVLLDD